MTLGTIQGKEDGYALVEIQRQDMCGECHACDMTYGKKEYILRCLDVEGSQVGEEVEILLKEENFLRATYKMYGIPFIGFIVGLAVGYILSKVLIQGLEDLMMIIGALLGVMVGLLIIRRKEKQQIYRKYLPRIKKISK